MCAPLCCLRSVCMSALPLALCVAFVLLLKCCFIFLCRFLFLYANMPYVFITHTHIYIYVYCANLSFFCLHSWEIFGVLCLIMSRVVVVMDYATVGSDLFCLLYFFSFSCALSAARYAIIWPQTLKTRKWGAKMAANERGRKSIKYN